jgi:putative flippase GtrA
VARALLYLRREMRNESHARILAALGGGASTAADVAVLALLVESGAPIAPSAFAGSLCGALVSFLVNKYVAFRDRSPVCARQLFAFGLVAAATALIMALAMQLVAVDLGVPYLLAKAMCAAAVFIVWSYPAQKRVFRFRRPSGRTPILV